MPVDVDACMYPPFFPDEDKESIMDKRGMCSRGIKILQYLVSTLRNKVWFMCKHKTSYIWWSLHPLSITVSTTMQWT